MQLYGIGTYLPAHIATDHGRESPVEASGDTRGDVKNGHAMWMCRVIWRRGVRRVLSNSVDYDEGRKCEVDHTRPVGPE
jgi:hypothetical protein